MTTREQERIFELQRKLTDTLKELETTKYELQLARDGCWHLAGECLDADAELYEARVKLANVEHDNGVLWRHLDTAMERVQQIEGQEAPQ